jgi:hypothetical protein
MWEEQFAELSSVAGRQDGLITTAQATRSGITEPMLDHFKETGLIVELQRGVHQLAGSALAPRYAYPLAAWLALRPERFRWERLEGEPDAVVSHESACQVHGLGSVSAPAEVVTAPEPLPGPPGTTVHVARLAADEVTTCSGVPVTTARRTIADLVRDWAEDADVARVLSDAVRHDLVDLEEVHRDLAPLAAEHGYPAAGRDFVSYFVPDLAPTSLSPRNRRAYAALVFPDRVAALRERVGPLLAAEGGAGDEELSRDVAAEIVTRTLRAGQSSGTGMSG